MLNATPLTTAEKKPVKKLFDRPATAENHADKPKKALHSSTAKKITKPSDLDNFIQDGKAPNVYGLAMLVLVILILWTGVLIVEQVQNYHTQYSELQKLKREHRTLEIEHQRLLIEQQTFSATPQIAKRAVAELNMYYPQLSDRMILQSNPTAPATSAASIATNPHSTSQHNAEPKAQAKEKPSQKPAMINPAINNAPVTTSVANEAAR